MYIMDGNDLGEAVIESVNSGINTADFKTEISNSHRYLQSEVFNQIVKPIICGLAKNAETESYDQRNKSAVMKCKQIAEEMNWKIE